MHDLILEVEYFSQYPPSHASIYSRLTTLGTFYDAIVDVYASSRQGKASCLHFFLNVYGEHPFEYSMSMASSVFYSLCT